MMGKEGSHLGGSKYGGFPKDAQGFPNIMASAGLNISNFLNTIIRERRATSTTTTTTTTTNSLKPKAAASLHLSTSARFESHGRQASLEFSHTEPSTTTITTTTPAKKVELGSEIVSKEYLGSGTWTLLHMIGAQFPEKPTKQQQRDVKELMAVLSRLYPCPECAGHFKEILKANPVEAGSGHELSHWLCRVHNIVNRSLGKPTFPCQRVDARWGALSCDGACDLHGRPSK